MDAWKNHISCGRPMGYMAIFLNMDMLHYMYIYVVIIITHLHLPMNCMYTYNHILSHELFCKLGLFFNFAYDPNWIHLVF